MNEHGQNDDSAREVFVAADALIEALNQLANMRGFNQASQGASDAMLAVSRARIEYRAARAAWEARNG